MYSNFSPLKRRKNQLNVLQVSQDVSEFEDLPADLEIEGDDEDNYKIDD